jgi:hypothetical protein
MQCVGVPAGEGLPIGVVSNILNGTVLKISNG